MEKHKVVLKSTEIFCWLCFSVLKYFDCTFVFSMKNKKGDYSNLSGRRKVTLRKKLKQDSLQLNANVTYPGYE